MAALKRFEAAQPAHGLFAGQTRHGGGGVQGGRNREGLFPLEMGGDRRVQMHQLTVAGQAGMPGAARVEACPAQHRGDGVDDQIVLVAIFDRLQQFRGPGAPRGGAGQGITAQLVLTHGEQPFWRRADQG